MNISLVVLGRAAAWEVMHHALTKLASMNVAAEEGELNIVRQDSAVAALASKLGSDHKKYLSFAETRKTVK